MMTRYMRLFPTLLIGVAIAGCTTSSPQQQTARICNSSGCVDQDRNIQTFVPQDDPRFSPPRDVDSYAGERLADLEASANAGNPIAAYKRGIAALSGIGAGGKSPAEAARWFRLAADGGHTWAAYRLGEMYRNGTGVPRNLELALSYLNGAAQARQPLAANSLGVMALNGEGVGKDTARAAEWFTIAAEQGVADSQYNLALLTFQGDGIRQNLYNALQWMRAAAANGSAKAQTAVGRLYMTGLDTMGQDIKEAKKWLGMAADKGDPEAQKLLSELLREEKEYRDYQRRLTELAAQTAVYWAQATLVRELNTTTIRHYWYW
ncbi:MULTISPECIES: tetratricopeptide repeat protein [unclassified Azospirillum]|uniref:tetratricopeptide repeat protein n=1 Tax=unclassified Azospirillum TaxID=2630922 RepID=UPI000B788498|nr:MULTISPECIES: tetratricopeptide repeat protein [unclassified Azospirillum]